MNEDARPADSGTAAPRRWRAATPQAITIAYFIFGAIWVFVSDRVLAWFDLSPGLTLRLQTSKGWLFVIGSTLLLYFLLRRHQQQHATTVSELYKSREEVRAANAELEARVQERTAQLEFANRELEAFVYAVSHDLRAPLRSISGFSQILRESAPDGLDEKSAHYLERIHAASERMATLIEDLLSLSRISRSEFVPRAASVTQIATDAAASVRERYPGREVTVAIAPDMNATCDTRLLRVALENLLDNAWKYTSKQAAANITVGAHASEHGPAYFVRDNGVGFDMRYLSKLFAPFQRLHPQTDFPGTGIGLVTVQRIVTRHGGRVWAEAEVDRGATFWFTLHE